MMRRLGNLAALSLSAAVMVACGTDSPNPGPTPDARVFDSPVATTDSPVASADSPTATPDSPAAALPDSGTGAGGTVALHTVVGYDPTAGNPVGPRAGQATIAFTPPTGTIESVGHAAIPPCFADSFDVTTIPTPLDGGNVTFTVTHTSGPVTTASCVFNGTSKVYDCTPDPTAIDLADSDMVRVQLTGNGAFTAYDNTLTPAGHTPVPTADTNNLLKAPIDLSGDVDLHFAITDTVNMQTGLAFVVVIDATNATNAGATDLGTDATKTASLTCSAALANTMTVPKSVVKVLGGIAPTKIRLSIFHDQSDLGLLGTNKNVVIGQGLITFPAIAQ